MDLWFASPKRFDQFDSEKIGTGSGVSRHGDGFYFGPRDVAEDYLASYKGFNGADVSIEYKGRNLYGNALEAAEEIVRNGLESAQDRFKDRPEMAQYLNDHFSESLQVTWGMLAKVSIPDLDVDSLPHWDDEVPVDTMTLIGMSVLEKLTVLDESLKEDLRSLNVNPDECSSVEQIIDDLFDEAMDKAHEDDLVPSGVDDEDLREDWFFRAIGEIDSVSNVASEFYQSIGADYFSVLDRLCSRNPSFSREFSETSGLSYGSLHSLITSTLSNASKDYPNAGIITSESILCENGIPGFRAPAMGPTNQEEVVIYDASLLDGSKVMPMDIGNGIDREDEPSI